MKEVCIIASPRTGTTHLCSLWENFEHHRSLYEIFHPHKSYCLAPFLPDLNAAFHLAATDTGDPAFTAALQNAPLQTLATLSAAIQRDGDTSLSYKVFPGHLRPDRLESLVARDNVVFLIVKRRLIDAYISEMKAQALQTWRDVDTTATQVALSYPHFQSWAATRRTWYAQTQSLIARHTRPFQTMTYEADIDIPPARHLATAQDKLASLGLKLSQRGTRLKSDLTKQDQASSYPEKVSNWDQFCADARAAGSFDPLFQPD